MDELLNKLCETLKKLMRLPSAADLSGFLEGETAFMLALKHNGDKPNTPSVLSEELNVTKGRITAIINSLSRRDMVRLEKIDGDRRKINVRLTDAGLKFIDAKLESVNKFLGCFIERVGRDKAENLVQLLDYTAKAMEDARVEGLKSAGGGAVN